jgi:5-enolpyruvylshikimate-3-phosphate synthase
MIKIKIKKTLWAQTLAQIVDWFTSFTLAIKSSDEIHHAIEADASDISDLIYATLVVCCFASEQPYPECYKASETSNGAA